MIVSNLTNGFGNNLFQCIAGKLLATFHNHEHYFVCEKDYYCKDFLCSLGFKFYNGEPSKLQKSLIVNDKNYMFAFDKNYSNNFFLLSGYFENKDYYEENRSLIMSWFPSFKKTNNDLVFHFRTGDRLFYQNEFASKPSPSSIKKAIGS